MISVTAIAAAAGKADVKEEEKRGPRRKEGMREEGGRHAGRQAGLLGCHATRSRFGSQHFK